MELRVLNYFKVIAEEKNISKAAEKLYITQPTLSRQMKELEEELNTTLFIRGNKKLRLTEDGILFLKHANEILELCTRAKEEFEERKSLINGDIYIGSGESYHLNIIAKVIKELQSDYSDIRFHFYSGDAEAVIDKFDKNLIDFAIFIGSSINDDEYEYVKLPLEDTWGILMRSDNKLAEKEYIIPQDIKNEKIINSQQRMGKSLLSGWYGKNYNKLNIVATYNLLYNASLLVENGVGIALALEKIIDVPNNRNLCFRPLSPHTTSSLFLAWKKTKVFSPAGKKFLEKLKVLIPDFP